ncbi:putative polysaccharide biosynthesis protein [Gemelliphila palaticanis]|uniref:Oligosaccharide flippase family protein n=1 Tax=Gemelliphila palaticanis TaxID=81950 RepID=A0ABX2T2V1_9BACL|nr:oligosaccharide flippase family protein [Gemella palaticanis]MBF0716023.1 oligosaccharide flippase family protein [Gemella palaticanis]NYS47953.1 oligosaccharide flippase family protein [Gemella palaticanis]
MKKDSLFKGTFILSISLILTKIIGLVYIIPYYKIIGGEENMSLFNYAYNYYIILLEVSSAGIPLTISKLISKYNGEGNYAKSRQIYKVGSSILIISGFIGFLIFFFGSNYLALETIGSKGVTRYSISDLSLVIKTLGFAFPFVLLASGFRGLFQGHEIMVPSAISQFFEQFIRVIAMLLGTYFVMKLTNNVVYGNAMATFSTVIGAIISVSILLYYFKKYSKGLDFNKENISFSYKQISTLDVAKEIFLVSIPFVVVSTFFVILTLIDQNTIIDTMYDIGKTIGKGEEFAKRGELEFTIYSGLINKVVMIAVSLAPAFTGVFLPAITRLYSQKKIEDVSININKVLLSLLMIVFPTLVGMYALAEPLYNSFFSPNEAAYVFLRVYVILALLYSIYAILSIIMQAIDKQKLNMIIVAIGIIFKFIFNKLFITNFGTIGAIYCSIATYVIIILLTILVIDYSVKIKLRELIFNFSKIIVSSIIMFIIVLAIFDSIISNFNINYRIDSMLLILICAIFGGLPYLILINKLNLFGYLFGKKISILSILRRK